MLNSKLSRSALSLLLAMMLVFSMFTLGAFAETEADGVTTEAITDAGETEAETTADDGHDHDHDHDDEKIEEEKGLSTFDIVSLIILGVLVIVGVVYCLKNREKVGKFLRSLRSEIKKISWSSWRDVRKNTLVVIVVVVIVAVAIGLVDFLFSRGILAMKSLFS